MTDTAGKDHAREAAEAERLRRLAEDWITVWQSELAAAKGPR